MQHTGLAVGLLAPKTLNGTLRLATVLFACAAQARGADKPKPQAAAPQENAAKNAAEPDGDSASQGVSALCVDRDGKPVVGAEVHIFQCVVGEPGRYKEFGPFSSDETGRATCPRAVVKDGRGRFDRWAYARVPGRLVGVARSAMWKNRAVVNPEFRIELHPSRSVEGVVTVPEGFDPTDVNVHVQTLVVGLKFNSFPREPQFAGLDSALPEIFDKRPDAAGRIRFDDVPLQGRLYLLTAAKGLAEAQWMNKQQDAFDEPIQLNLAREGVLTGHALSPAGKPAARINVAARLSFIPDRQVAYLTTFKTQTNEHGEFALHGLPDTRFVLSLEDPSHESVARPRERLSVAAGKTEDLTVTMEVPVAVSGRVFDPEGKPVEGAAISALADTQEGPGLADDMTDREGRYHLRLPRGRAKLYFNSLPDGFVYPDPQIINRLEILAEQGDTENLDFTIYRNADDGKRAGKAKHPETPALVKHGKPDPVLAEHVAKIAQQNAQRETEFSAKLQVVKHDDQKVAEANRRYFEDKRERTEDLMYFIAEHAADPAAFDGVLLLVGEMHSFLDESLTEIVLDHHLADPDMGRLCFALRHRGGEEWAARILKAVAEKHPKREVRGQAVFALGDYHRNQAFPYRGDLTEAERTRLVAEASHFYRRALDEFADTLTPDGKATLGEKAAHELTRFKNLPDLRVGRPAPPIAAEALDGKPMSLADYRGQVVLLVFWGSWCGPCIEMVPHERKLAETYRGRPFAVVGVNCGDTREVAKVTMESERMTWRCWWDGEETGGPIETDYDVPQWPRVFVIDAEGVIRAIDPEIEDLDRTIEKLLQNATTPEPRP